MPRVRVLSDQELAGIQDASLDILERVGILVRHEGMRGLLAASGAGVREGNSLVTLPARLIESCLAVAPRSFSVMGLSPSDDKPLSIDDGPYARAAAGIDAILDDETGTRRPATQSDAAKWSRLVESLDGIHLNSPLYPQDLPGPIRDVAALESSLRFSRKPVVICAYSKKSTQWMSRLTSVLPRGGGSRVILVFSCDSPLVFSEEQVDIMMVAASSGFPILLNTASLAGATAPVTRMGCMVQMNAELMAALALVQIAFPGAPVICDAQPLIFDMRTGSAAFGYAELGIMNAAFTELARGHKLPVESSGMKTDSHTPGAQAASEKVLTGYLSALAGATILSGAGCLATAGTASPAQLVLDEELFGQVFHVLEGIPAEDVCAIRDVIGRIGAGGNYLADEHTLRHFRTEYRISTFGVREGYDSWQVRGRRTMECEAAERARKILSNPEQEAVDDQTGRELSLIVQEAREALVADGG